MPELFDVSAVAFGSLIQTTLAAGVCITSSNVYCRVYANVPLDEPVTATPTGAPFIQSKFTALLIGLADEFDTMTVLAKPIALTRSFASFQNLKLKHRLLLFAMYHTSNRNTHGEGTKLSAD